MSSKGRCANGSARRARPATVPPGGAVEDGEAANLSVVQQFAHDEGGFYGLADTHVVGDKETDGRHLEGHKQGNELVGPGFHCNVAETAEGTCRRAELEPECVPQEKA